MSGSRSHTREMALPVPASRVFEMLLTPSDICAFRGASRAIVIPREGGTWIAARGGRD